ncbi:hypothetical protein Pelo_7426 [Pelomyxa schiedti]|nr:hypothetical protein Pelo_7426 [Pelomyxa schiedti]
MNEEVNRLREFIKSARENKQQQQQQQLPSPPCPCAELDAQSSCAEAAPPPIDDDAGITTSFVNGVKVVVRQSPVRPKSGVSCTPASTASTTTSTTTTTTTTTTSTTTTPNNTQSETDSAVASGDNSRAVVVGGGAGAGAGAGNCGTGVSAANQVGGYITVDSSDGYNFFVPVEPLYAESDWFRRLLQSNTFVETRDRHVTFQFSANELEIVLMYIMNDFLLNGALQPDQKRIVFNFYLSPNHVMDVLMTAQYLEIPSLLSFCIKMICHNLEGLTTLDGVPTDVVTKLYASLNPYQLCLLESSSAHANFLDTSCFWKTFCVKDFPDESKEMPVGWSWKDMYVALSDRLKFRKSTGPMATDAAIADYKEFLRCCGSALKEAFLLFGSVEDLPNFGSIASLNITLPDDLPPTKMEELCTVLHDGKYPNLRTLLFKSGTIPDSTPLALLVMPSCNVQLHNLSFIESNMTTEALNPFGQALVNNSYLEALILCKNNIASLSFLQPLSASSHLKYIDCSSNPVQEMRPLFHLNIQNVIINNTSLSEKGYLDMARYIAHPSCTWVSLSMSFSSIDEESIYMILFSIGSNQSLSQLDISNIALAAPAVNTLSESLQWNHTLTSLNLSNCKCFNHYSFDARRDILPFTRLVSVDLARNGITTNCILSFISECVRLHESGTLKLKHINLSGNSYDCKHNAALESLGVEIEEPGEWFGISTDERQWRYRGTAATAATVPAEVTANRRTLPLTTPPKARGGRTPNNRP